MTLLFIILLSSVFLFVDAGPLTVVCIFLIICYIPGLSLLAFSRKANLYFEDLVLAFPYSVGVSGMLTIGILTFGIDVKHIPLLILLFSGVLIAHGILGKKKYQVSSAIHVKGDEIRFIFFALFITLLLSIPYFLGPDHTSISTHVFHHSSMITQIVNGIFPPENPGLGGTVIGYYWGFHAFIAALSVKTGYHPIQIVFLLNALSLYAIFCITYAFAKTFDLKERYCYLLPLAVIGIMRFDAGIIFLYKLFSGKLITVDQIDVALLHPSDLLRAWLSGLSWIDTRLLFIRKFYKVTGMPLAIALCFSYLLLLRLIIKNKGEEYGPYKIILCIVIAACLFIYPPLAIFILLHAPIWSLYIFLSNSGDFKEKAREALNIAIPFIIAVVIATPYILFVITSRSASSSGQGSIFSLDVYLQSLKNIVIFLIPLPLVFYGAWRASNRMSDSRDHFFLIIGTALCLFLTIMTRWPFDNSYKFNYIQTFFFAFYFVFGLSGLLALIGARWLKGLTAAIVALFLLLPPVVVMTAHIAAALNTEYRYNFSGKHFIYDQDKQKNEAYEWIRQNTPKNALVMLSYVETTWSCCGLNPNYEIAALTERNLYVIKDKDYTFSNPEYARRIQFREKLFDSPDDPDVLTFFKTLKRPVYLLVEEDLPKRFIVEERFINFPTDPGKQFIPVFHNDSQRVYLVAGTN